MNKLLVTGSSGLIGSEVVDYFCKLGWEVHGVDNNMRADFFGAWRRHSLEPETAGVASHQNFHHHELDIRDRAGVDRTASRHCGPTLLVHTAAQPSHDLAASRPFDDFDVNAVGTLNLLEAARRHAPECRVRAHEHQQGLWRPAQHDSPQGTAQRAGTTTIPPMPTASPKNFRSTRASTASFGASKVAGDVMVQEYGRYFGLEDLLPARRLPHRAQPQRRGTARIPELSDQVQRRRPALQSFWLQGQTSARQHPFTTMWRASSMRFMRKPRCGEVYNIGGGRANSVSILEAFDRIAALSGKKMNYEYVDKNREGDHICYISDLTKMREHCPAGNITARWMTSSRKSMPRRCKNPAF